MGKSDFKWLKKDRVKKLINKEASDFWINQFRRKENSEREGKK